MSSEISDERAVAKLSLNFSKSSRPAILIRDPRRVNLARACQVFFSFSPGEAVVIAEWAYFILGALVNLIQHGIFRRPGGSLCTRDTA